VPSVCFYFQVHQPSRLRRYSIFDTDRNYFDGFRNSEICRKLSQKCYQRANRLMLDLIHRHEGRFRISYSLSGIVLEQFERFAPEVMDQFKEMNDTGCVEFLAEPYHHSLSFLYSREEFTEQVRLHSDKIWQLFRQKPSVFCNTELIYNNDLAHFVSGLGYRGILSEGVPYLLGNRSPNYVYCATGTPKMALLLRNAQLSDDIAFRFCNHAWPEWPLTAEKFARWISQTGESGDVVNLFMNYEAFGDRLPADCGIFDFLAHLPGEILDRPGNDFKTPSEVIEAHPPRGECDVPHMISWADSERDLSAFLGNAMQSNALHELYRLEREVKSTGDPQILQDWRCLQSSDHFLYMCTKQAGDGDVHKFFNPYDSPYDSYINFMNVLDNLRLRIGARLRERLQNLRA